jgi:pyruvate formate lyase activating enzyme
MNIGGFQKNSLIDFPGQIAAVVFTSGCNLICPYCHNPELAADPAAASEWTPEAVMAFLNKRRGLLQGVAITGGEPTLQKDLMAFCKQIKDMGYKIKLDSNGTRPNVLADLFDRDLVDYLAMDIKTDLAHYPGIMKGKDKNREKDVEKIRESVRLIMDRAPAYEFRTTCARPFVTRNIMPQIGALISGAALFVLQPCSRNVHVLDPDFPKDESHFFTDQEMGALKDLVAPFVNEVRIR